MASDKDLRVWVADQLCVLMGASESTIVNYILSVAKRHTSAASLSTALAGQGLPAGSTAAFAAELLSRLPQRSVGPSQFQVQHKEATAFARRNKKYDILDDDEPAPPVPSTSTAAPAPSRKAERQLRTAKAAAEDQEDDTVVRRGQRHKRKWEEDEPEEQDEEGRMEAARERDRREVLASPH
jgi:pre-mRNA-splicing factor ATP-dependent RNA helicase DHX16